MDNTSANYDPFVELGVRLTELAVKGTASAVNKKIRAIKEERNVEKLRTTYDELINEVLQEREEAVRIAQTYKAEIDRIVISDDDIEHLYNTVARIIEIFKTVQIASALSKGADEIDKVKKRVKSVLEPGNPSSSLDINGGLYGAKLYDNARKKLIPVFGTPDGKSIKLKKSDESMIVSPADLEGHNSIYAVIPNSKRSGGFIPESSYVFVDSSATPNVGDLALIIDKDFSKMSSEDTAEAQIVVVRQDTHGKKYGHVSNPDEKLSGKSMHKIVMIVMK